jgi:hypothetical protein
MDILAMVTMEVVTKKGVTKEGVTREVVSKVMGIWAEALSEATVRTSM